MNIAIITGEASGDRVGAQLAQEILRRRPDAQVWGTGGKYLRAAGVEVVVDSARWGAIGLVSALQMLPRVLKAWGQLKKEIVRRQPDVIIPVDAGAFNLGFGAFEGLCPYLRRSHPHLKILYYFPPGSWRRTLKTTPLAQLADEVATPFPWSETELRRLGANATFVGHPLLDLVKPVQSPDEFSQQYGVDRTRPVVGILPGSRIQEIEEILPVQLAAASIIHQRVPAVQFLIARAPTVDHEVIAQAIHRERESRRTENQKAHDKGVFEKPEIPTPGSVPVVAEGRGTTLTPAELEEQRKKWLARAADLPDSPSGEYPIAIVDDATYDVMAASDVLLITSGTATLEAMILGKPMVIVYRLSTTNIFEYLVVKKRLPTYFGMPNILAERGICPELIQEAATSEAMAHEVIGLLLEPDRMLRMREDLRAVTALLGEPGGAGRTAEMVLEMAMHSAGNPAR